MDLRTQVHRNIPKSNTSLGLQLDFFPLELDFFPLQYSVVGLVCPRGEEQISGPSALSKFKKPSKRSQKGPRSCQKYSKLCYDHFGGRLEASNPPPIFTLSQSEGYWTVSSFFLLHRISFHQAHSISHFLANHISADQKVGLMAEVWQN